MKTSTLILIGLGVLMVSQSKDDKSKPGLFGESNEQRRERLKTMDEEWQARDR